VCSSSFRSISIDVDRAVDSASVPLGSKKKIDGGYLAELASIVALTMSFQSEIS
jgi:hypothetical protein